MKVEEIEKLLADATPGPWKVGYMDDTPSRGGQFWWIRCPQGALGYMPKPDVHDDNYVRFSYADARLIAAAPTVIRQLLERNKKLEHLHECVRWDRECEYLASGRGMRAHIRAATGTAKAAQRWTENGQRSAWRIHSESRLALRDALAALDANDVNHEQD